MSITRSIELRKNISGSYKIRLTINRGNRFCGARKSLGLGTRQEECALKRAYLMRCVLSRMGWFPGGRTAVRQLKDRKKKEIVVWDAVNQPSGGLPVRINVCKDISFERTVVIWYQVNGGDQVRRLELPVDGWTSDDPEGDLRILMQGLQHCATEQRQLPCRILRVEMMTDEHLYGNA